MKNILKSQFYLYSYNIVRRKKFTNLRTIFISSLLFKKEKKRINKIKKMNFNTK